MDYFSLNDSESAVIRILSSSVDKIERGSIHTIQVNGKNKKVRCLEDNCPLCAANNAKSDRLFVHLWDYTDNSEKVWNRTPNYKFIQSLIDIEADWGPINESVIRISRDGVDFPKYNVTPIRASNYHDVDSKYIDVNYGWMCSTYRSADELKEYLKTGVLPDHVKKQQNKEWLPKEEWLAQQNANKNNADNNKKVDHNSGAQHTNNTSEDYDYVADTLLDDDPFSSFDKI